MPQKNWDKYEVALLIEAYQNIKQGKVDKMSALNTLSQNLRKMAQNEGLEIDDTFRNMDGMQWQLGFIERAFIGDDYESRTPPKIFIEVVEIYNGNQQEFQDILAEAKRKIKGNITEEMEISDAERKELFIKWLTENTNIQPSSVVSNIDFVSKYASKRNIAKKDFWSFDDYREFNIVRVKLSGNKFFKLMHGKEHRQFEKNGKLYSDFLKEEQSKNIVNDAIGSAPKETITQSEPHVEIIVDETTANTVETNISKELAEAEENLILAKYSLWLVQEKNLSYGSSQSYASNLKIAINYAQEKGLLNCSLFKIADDDLLTTVSKILTNDEFSQYNSEQHNRFSAALQAYLMFKIGIKATGVKRKKSRKHQKDAIVCPAELKEILLKKFPYGLRLDSAIDILKLKNFAEMLGVDLPEDAELLRAQISAAGIHFEGKTYFISNEVLEAIINRIEDVFAEGYNVIYYEELLNADIEWFDENHIQSWELIREILCKNNDNLYISKNFLRQGTEHFNESDAVEAELENVWGDEVIHTYDELYELLPYIPDEKIRAYLSYSKKFVWSSYETFAWIDKIIVTEEEKEEIIDYVTNECEHTGHASIANVPLGDIEEVNYQISITAIYDAIYNLILKDKFAINGKILTKMDSEVDALTLAKNYCAGKDVCTFTELNEYVTAVNGTSNRQIAFQAAYDQFIRVEVDKFVADKFISFDIDMIDNLLEEAIKDGFTAIRNITTFIIFPNCGHVWTYYLLESFCYRFSKKFRLAIMRFNDKNAGLIVKKDTALSYIDMLAIITAKSKLELRTDIIGQYLYENGYISRKKTAMIDNIIDKAKIIREGK